jgi:hypothetical protein
MTQPSHDELAWMRLVRLLLFALTVMIMAVITTDAWQYAVSLGLTPCVDGAPVRDWVGCEHPDQRAPTCECVR